MRPIYNNYNSNNSTNSNSNNNSNPNNNTGYLLHDIFSKENIACYNYMVTNYKKTLLQNIITVTRHVNLDKQPLIHQHS